MVDQYLHAEITRKVIGCAMKVHATLGNGFQEVIYQRSLAIEMHDSGLNFAREIEMPLFYKENEVGTRRVDFLVEQKVLVELKAITEITPVHHAQIINYLNAYKLNIGLLINFGEKSLPIKDSSNQRTRCNPIIRFSDNQVQTKKELPKKLLFYFTL